MFKHLDGRLSKSEEGLRLYWVGKPQVRSTFIDYELVQAIRRDNALHCAYIKRFQNGEAVENVLLAVNAPIIKRVVQRYKRYWRDWSDCWQEGRLALLTACLRYDSGHNATPYTWIQIYVRSYIRRYLIRSAQAVPFPVHRYDRKQRSPNSATGAAAWKYGTLKIEHNRTVLFSDHKNAHWSNGPADTTGLSFEETLVDENALALELLEEEDVVAKMPDLVWQLTRRLTAREREIVHRRFMKEEPDVLASIGSELNLTRERIRQLESIALEKLRMQCRIVKCDVHRFRGRATFYEWVSALAKIDWSVVLDGKKAALEEESKASEGREPEESALEESVINDALWNNPPTRKQKETLEALQNLGGTAVIQDIAKALGIRTMTAYARLSAVHERGYVVKRNYGTWLAPWSLTPSGAEWARVQWYIPDGAQNVAGIK